MSCGGAPKDPLRIKCCSDDVVQPEGSHQVYVPLGDGLWMPMFDGERRVLRWVARPQQEPLQEGDRVKTFGLLQNEGPLCNLSHKCVVLSFCYEFTSSSYCVINELGSINLSFFFVTMCSESRCLQVHPHSAVRHGLPNWVSLRDALA